MFKNCSTDSIKETNSTVSSVFERATSTIQYGPGNSLAFRMVKGKLLVSTEILFFQVWSSAISHTRMDSGPIPYLSQGIHVRIGHFLIAEYTLFAEKI